MIKPIRPDQVNPFKPDKVIETFNEFIQAYWDGEQAKFLARDIAKAIAKRMGVNDSEVYEKGYLDIEGIYQQAGWDVSYNKPDFNELIPFHPYFLFRKG